MSRRLGELLVRENLITPDQLKKALEEAKNAGGRLGESLSKLGILDETELADFLSKHYKVPSINLEEFDIDPEIIKLVSAEICEKHTIIPVNRAGPTLIIATADPSNIYVADDIKFLTGYNVEMVVAPESQIKKAIEKYYGKQASDNVMSEVMQELSDAEIESVEEEEDIDVKDLEKATQDAPIVKLVNHVLTDAIAKGASDIHVEPYEKFFRIRYRVDGVLHEAMQPPMKFKNAVISRLKIMSSLDIAERRIPQDGRIKLRVKDKEVDFRVSTLPTLFGEKVVLRILDKSNLQLDLTKLGFEEEQLKLFREAIEQPYGMVLVTGPTGSGKTTTLYSALMELNQITDNISTAEDPVEYNLPGINQVQINDEVGLNFAAALRSFLRQDPDIILVGEIRDFETAEIAVKAALTGHLVLSTLHTNDAPSSITRLLNMGVEPFLVTASVNAVIAQRLVRKICSNCKTEADVPPKLLIEMGMDPEEANEIKCYKGAGCEKCSGKGYKGRLALYEIMPLWEELKEMVLNGASAGELKKEAVRLGMSTLRMSGLQKIKEGLTTTDEVLAITAKD
jgi:type IV pilus assembly protein PilB